MAESALFGGVGELGVSVSQSVVVLRRSVSVLEEELEANGIENVGVTVSVVGLKEGLREPPAGIGSGIAVSGTSCSSAVGSASPLFTDCFLTTSSSFFTRPCRSLFLDGLVLVGLRANGTSVVVNEFGGIRNGLI